MGIPAVAGNPAASGISAVADTVDGFPAVVGSDDGIPAVAGIPAAAGIPTFAGTVGGILAVTGILEVAGLPTADYIRDFPVASAADDEPAITEFLIILLLLAPCMEYLLFLTFLLSLRPCVNWRSVILSLTSPVRNVRIPGQL